MRRTEGRAYALLLVLLLCFGEHTRSLVVPVAVEGILTFTPSGSAETYSVTFPTNNASGSVWGGNGLDGGASFLGNLTLLSHNVYAFSGGSNFAQAPPCASTSGSVTLVSGTATADPATW